MHLRTGDANPQQDVMVTLKCAKNFLTVDTLNRTQTGPLNVPSFSHLQALEFRLSQAEYH